MQSKQLDNATSDSVSDHVMARALYEETNFGTDLAGGDVEIKFKVRLQGDLLPQEMIGIVGGCDALGNWQADSGVLMHHRHDEGVWEATVALPSHQVIEYRYFVCTLNAATRRVNIRYWEAHFRPRSVATGDNDQTTELNDELGIIDGQHCINRGWLTTETVVQLRICDSAFTWQDTLSFEHLHLKVTPQRVTMQKDGNEVAFVPLEPQSQAIVEVVKMKYGNSKIRQQPTHGIVWQPNDVIMFHVTLDDLLSTALLIEVYGSEKELTEPPKRIGYYHLLIEELCNSHGEMSLQINSADSPHRSAGTLDLSYLVIQPLQSGFKLPMRNSLSKFWKIEWPALDIGHRGMGVSFSVSAMTLTEPTVASMRNAAKFGADMVEMDVHVTKDRVPVIYHDFQVNLSHISHGERLTAPLPSKDSLLIKDLTYSDLKELRHNVRPTIRNGEDPKEHLIFPKLEEMLLAVDPVVAFDIEVKWPQEYIDGQWESTQTIDKNLFVDTILDCLLRNGRGRCMVLSSFDADICTMMRFKQNFYPVLLLTHRPDEVYPLFKDPRLHSVEMAVCNAEAMDLVGIIPQCEDLIANPSGVWLAHQKSQLVFCWTDHTLTADTIDRLKDLGLNGVIYDKIDQILVDKDKRRIFDCQHLLTLSHLEIH